MADVSGMHSNATNFQSFVHNHVDQRTGQYMLSIDLPMPTGNDLIGPGLPLRLSYSPYNQADVGFGKGWQLAMTHYVPATRMLSLHTGESYKVTGTGPQPSIREKKIHSFHFHDDGADDKGPYRVMHKSGLVEVLTLHGVDNPIALPTRVMAPSGHGITLSYIPENRRLEKIVDDKGHVLIALSYSNGSVFFDIRPGTGDDGQPFARYRLELENRILVQVMLPSETGGNWRFGYTTAQGLRCLSKVHTPSGAIEDVYYGENGDPGHLLPGTQPQRALPRVTTHEVKPRANQPPLKTTYTYSHRDEQSGAQVEHSFVGSNSTISWRDDGEDNLYRASASYRYSVTAHYWKAGKVVRKQTQTFNRYHLLTRQTLEQAGHVEETETVFHERLGDGFDDQPRYFQLPKSITKRWTLHDDASQSKVETATTSYDDYGNVIEEQAPTGVRTTYTYYDKEGEKDGDAWACPPDPQGFVRNVKSKTVYPAEGLPGEAPVQRTRLTYKAYPVLPGLGQVSQWLAPCEEKVLLVLDPDSRKEREQVLLKVERTYLNTPDNSFLHGRPDYQVTTRYGDDGESPVRRAIESRSARVEWTYRTVTDETYGLEYWTDETITGFDLTQKTTRSAASSLHGQPVYQEDETGNSIRRRYDVLSRLLEETVAPGQGVDEASVSYAYGLVTHPEAGVAGLASQTITSSTGVVTIITHDGCSRMVTEKRETEDPTPPETASDTERPRQCQLVTERTYDELGQLREETTFDYHDGKTLTLTSLFEYDAWGRLCKTTLPNGASQHSEFSPFGETGDVVTRWMESPDKPQVRQQQHVIESNRFDKPACQYRVDDTGKREFSYDGLGRCTHETHTFKRDGKLVSRVNTYTYDSEGRVTRTERPDQSAVLSQFALHSAAPLAEQLLVEPRKGAKPALAWKRTYDGLDRLKSLTAGKQQETYGYKPNTSLLESRTTAQRTFTYHYRATRSLQPTQIDVDTEQRTTFDYDTKTAALSMTKDEQGQHHYTYTDQGYLHKAQWKGQDAGAHHCDYRHSLQGLLLDYSESDGIAVSHTYNDMGQLECINQGNLVATLEYDTLGRLWKTTTQDLVHQQTLVCEQTYDALGREEKRQQTLSRKDDTVLTQQIVLTWQDDDQLHTRKLIRDGQQVLAETFIYDTLDRLEEYQCTGDEHLMPRNAAGRAITSQIFVYDALNNLTECYTDFVDGTSDTALYTYEGFILTKVVHSLQPDYPVCRTFDHDAEGNLLNDEQGNRLVYDDRGRLSEVRSADESQLLYRYRYDGHNDLIGVTHEQAAEISRRYQGYRLTRTCDASGATDYFYAGDRPMGLQRPGCTAENRLFLTDAVNSVTAECGPDALHDTTYTPYGDAPGNDQLIGLLGFNGEVRERALGWSLLGRGYRAYNPGLMRFHSPDTASPELAGINPYVYCGANPVNWHDPSGHYGMRNSMEDPYIPPIALKPKADWRSWLGVALGAVFAVISFLLLPPVGLTMAFALGAASLAIDVAATATSVAALATGSEAAYNWSFYLGVASALSTLGVMAYSRLGAKGTGLRMPARAKGADMGAPANAKAGDVFYRIRVKSTTPARFPVKRAIALPYQADAATQTTAMSVSAEVSTQTASRMTADAATSMTPAPSLRSVGSTRSLDSLDDDHFKLLFGETVTSPPGSPKQIVSVGSQLGFVRNPKTGHWEETGFSSYQGWPYSMGFGK